MTCKIFPPIILAIRSPLNFICVSIIALDMIRNQIPKPDLENLPIVRRRGVVGIVPAFQLSDPDLIPGGIKIFNFYLELSACSLSVFYPMFENY